MLKSILVLIFTLALTQAFGSEVSNPVDIFKGSCTKWDPGYAANCETCPKKVCPGNAKTCAKSQMKCIGVQNCNDWSRNVCSQWKTFCKKYVVNEPEKGALLGPKYHKSLEDCKLYYHGQKIFTTKLSYNDVTPDSKLEGNSGTGNKPGKNQGDQSGNTDSNGLHSKTPGFSGFGDFCERSKEWCPTTTGIGEQINDQIAKKELKKFIYSKGVERLIEGMKEFENNISMGGPIGKKPSDRLLDMACCGDLNSTVQGCLENTSYGNSSVALDSGLGGDWAPDFCKGRVNSCANAGKAPAAIESMNVSELTGKLARYTSDLKNHMSQMISAYDKLPVEFKISSTKACSEPLKPSQVKIGNPDCVMTNLSLAQTAAKIRSMKNLTPETSVFLDGFEHYSAKHRMMGTVPYVLLLTGDLRSAYSGKNAADIGSLKKAYDNMGVDHARVKKALNDFAGDVGNKALCSMKRLYSGRVKGNEDLNGLDDCTNSSDENRAMLASILKNPGLFEEIVETGQGLPANLTLEQVDRIACGVQRQTQSCQEMWKSWEPYTKTLKTGMGLAKYPLTLVAPYIAVPYFYAESAIDVANAVSDLDKASIREDQILASVLKKEIDDDTFMIELGDREEKLTKAKYGLLLEAVKASGDVYDLGKFMYVRIHGAEANQLTLLNLLDKGDKEEVSKFLKSNPKLKVEVSHKPFPPNKKKKQKHTKKGKK